MNQTMFLKFIFLIKQHVSDETSSIVSCTMKTSYGSSERYLTSCCYEALKKRNSAGVFIRRFLYIFDVGSCDLSETSTVDEQLACWHFA